MLRFTPMEELSSLKSETVDQGVIDSAGHAYPQPVLNVFFKSLYATKDLKCLDNNVYKWHKFWGRQAAFVYRWDAICLHPWLKWQLWLERSYGQAINWDLGWWRKHSLYRMVFSREWNHSWCGYFCKILSWRSRISFYRETNLSMEFPMALRTELSWTHWEGGCGFLWVARWFSTRINAEFSTVGRFCLQSLHSYSATGQRIFFFKKPHYI